MEGESSPAAASADLDTEAPQLKSWPENTVGAVKISSATSWPSADILNLQAFLSNGMFGREAAPRLCPAADILSPSDWEGLSMQVGDYVDTLLLPSSGMQNATVRWVPGPGEIVGALASDHLASRCEDISVASASLQEACISSVGNNAMHALAQQAPLCHVKLNC